MALNRQDRALMRQRGAASRKIDNIDFGFSFPTPRRRSERYSSRTPQSQTPAPRRLSKTPARRSREPSTARSVRESSAGPRNHGPSEAQTEDAISGDSDRPSKRRRLSENAETPVPVLAETPRSTATLRRSLRRKSGQMFTIAEDENAAESNDPADHVAENSLGRLPSSPLFVPEVTPEKENDLPDATALDQNNPDLAIGVPESENLNREPSLPIDFEDLIDNDNGNQEERQSSLLSNPPQDTEIVTQKPQRNRKSLAVERTKRPTKQVQPTFTEHESANRTQSSRAPSQQPSSPTAHSLTRRISKFSQIQRRGSGTQIETDVASPHARSPKETEDGDETYIQEESSPEPETPAANKKGGRQPRRRTAPDGSAQTTKVKQAKSTFPILTHRLTALSTLPTIEEGNESAEEAGNEQIVPRQLSNNRAQPNVVDILAQICRETISSLIERMSQNTQPSGRATLKNQKSALEVFGEDLNDELFEISEAAENRIDLEARVRRSKREKSGLQAEWIELRREREQIALKCDAVRRRHWEAENEAREKWALSEAARRVEHEMERNDAEEDDGLEFLLRSVADVVSDASSRGGILGRVKTFNAQLESMALFLEGRES